MFQVQEDKILDNFPALVQECNLERVAKTLIEKNGNVLARHKHKFKYIFDSFSDSTSDKLHFRRLFLFEIMKIDCFPLFVDALRDSGYGHLADDLHAVPDAANKKHISAFKYPANDLNDVVGNDVSYNNLPGQPRAGVIRPVTDQKLKIEVTFATDFHDTIQYNKCDFYHTRSRQRGCVLVINNYKFESEDYYRKGAEVDQENIKKLFETMGLRVDLHENKTVPEMKKIIEDFVRYSPDKVCDICFVIIMSHGEDHNNQTAVVGVDLNTISTVWITDKFNNNCKLFMHKPKIFMFQVCRGELIDQDLMPLYRTESDSLVIDRTTRIISDMLISYATVPGFKAMRDRDRGSWYIELICEVFMSHAHNRHVESLLKDVDKGLSQRLTERGAMQTSCFENYGFKNCYLHPGIYEENGNIVSYN